MSFLEKIKLYDIVPEDKAGDLYIKAEVYDYKDGAYAIQDEDDRVDCTIEMVPYDGDNADEHTISHNRSILTLIPVKTMGAGHSHKRGKKVNCYNSVSFFPLVSIRNRGNR